MLIHENDPLPEVMKAIEHEIKRAIIDRKHPFRYTVLTTSVASRYVVIREVGEGLKILIYTDARSSKIDQIRSHNFLQLLFYHPQKKSQVIVSGKAIIHHQNQLANEHWIKVKGEAIKSYSSVKAPGTEIKNRSEAYEWDESLGEKYFAVIEVISESLELLQLNTPKHIRARFDKENNWSGKWLVP